MFTNFYYIKFQKDKVEKLSTLFSKNSRHVYKCLGIIIIVSIDKHVEKGVFMNKKIYFPMLICMLFIVSYFIKQEQSISTINFFPIDDTRSFQQAQTSIKSFQTSEKDGFLIRWGIKSKSDSPLYLRQDISLLYENGAFKGALSKWKENTKVIYAQESFKRSGKQYYQAISFHHGEVHHDEEKITSIQTMTADKLYVIHTEDEKLYRFKQPQNKTEEWWQEKLDQQIEKKLLMYWTSLMNHYDIHANNYYTIPLTRLYTYNDEPLPQLTMDKTDQVIGQLWEGIYKNYLIPATRLKTQKQTHYIPVILLDKDVTHLLVLFELNGKKNKLIQQIS